MVMMMTTSLINMAHHLHYVVAITIPPNIVLRKNMKLMAKWRKRTLVDINHDKAAYIHKREHDDPHGLPQQQYLEGSTEIEHTLYSHTAISSPEIDSFKKLEYIYQHFQDSKRIYESDPDATM